MNQEFYVATASEPARYAIAIRERLAEGAVGLVTTETVCGLITRAPSEIDRLYLLKNRPLTMPISILISPDHPVVRWALRDLHFTRSMHELFPGPLTIVVPRHLAEDKLPVDVVMLGYKTYGFRAVYYPPLWPVLEGLGGMLFATSANHHGKPTPRNIEEVEPMIRNDVDFVLDGGNCPLGHASNVAIYHDNEWHFTRKLPRIPRLFIEWQAEAQVDKGQSVGLEDIPAVDVGSQDVGQRRGIVVDDYQIRESDDAPFWSERSLTAIKHAGRITYRNTASLTSAQRDMLMALASWSRVAPV